MLKIAPRAGSYLAKMLIDAHCTVCLTSSLFARARAHMRVAKHTIIIIYTMPLVSAKIMCMWRLVYTNKFLSHCVVTMVVHIVGRGVTMVMTALSVITETVRVLHT